MFSLNLNHFFRLAAGISFTLLSSVAFSQEFIAIKGNLLDAETKAPLDCASVTLAGASLGVVTGEKGEFTFYIPAKSSADTLVLGMLGYEQLRLPVSMAQAKKQFLLKSKSIPIEEVTVVAIPAKEILRRAFKSVKKNYPREPFLLTGDFQEYIREGDRYVRAMEASVSLYDKHAIGINDETFNIDSVSLSKNRIAERYLPILTVDQLVLTYIDFGLLLELGKVNNNLKYSIANVYFDGDEKVYEIVARQDSLEYTYRINASDYAIVYYSFKEAKISNGGETSDVWRDYLEWNQQIECRKQNGYYFPFRLSKLITIRYHKGEQAPYRNLLYTCTTISQFLVTNIRMDIAKSPFKKVRGFEDLFFTKAPVRKQWKHYNSLPNSEVRREALKQLGIDFN